MMDKPKQVKQIAVAEIPKYRTMIAKQQKFICPICGKSLASGGTIALDHDHKTGALRGTLHSSCNSAEGRTKAGAQTMQKTSHIVRTDYLSYLENLVKYLRACEDKPKRIIHPTFDLNTGKQKPKRRRVKKK